MDKLINELEDFEGYTWSNQRRILRDAIDRIEELQQTVTELQDKIATIQTEKGKEQ
jgi:hypothetical protein